MNLNKWQKFSRSGSYSGNDTQNRSIPHGLNKIPSLVIINNNASAIMMISQGHAKIYGSPGASGAVTAMDATNFYVGDGADYTKSANVGTSAYDWVAIP